MNRRGNPEGAGDYSGSYDNRVKPVGDPAGGPVGGGAQGRPSGNGERTGTVDGVTHVPNRHAHGADPMIGSVGVGASPATRPNAIGTGPRPLRTHADRTAVPAAASTTDPAVRR
ncbi:hypothetical protein [Streptomyces sp. NPDC006012]|uniref:hypothetical protein n=1 Tax=Streptomyces sp. NPDC006012 TaxID=3364739 RepID=UPI0036C17345